MLKRAKTYLNYRRRNLLYNALIRLLFEYCCTVWGNTKYENLLWLLRVQTRCARLILDASFSDNSVKLFSKLGWLPIDCTISRSNILAISIKLKCCVLLRNSTGCSIKIKKCAWCYFITIDFWLLPVKFLMLIAWLIAVVSNTLRQLN